MVGTLPPSPKIYHIVHVDRLLSIIADGCLWCDAEVVRRNSAGTSIGMNAIKQRRLNHNVLTSHPDLFVGQCVPFYFCPRSIMLYVIFKRDNPGLQYHGGQDHIIHLEANLHEVVAWADKSNHRWAFTLGNAGSFYFEDRSDLAHLNEINWDAVGAQNWSRSAAYLNYKDQKQAEFLVEKFFPWHLVLCIGVYSADVCRRVEQSLLSHNDGPDVRIMRNWYY